MTIEEIRANAPDGATHYILYKNGMIMYLDFTERMFAYYDRFSERWINGSAFLSFDKQTMESIGSL